MGAGLKKILNRGGLALMIVGGVAIVAAGGDVESALDTVGTAVTLAGGVMVFIREIFN